MESVLQKTLYGLADVLTRLHNRARLLIEEADPRTTNELLGRWERVAGLPDSCTDFSGSVQERRTALHKKLIRVGRQDRQYFIELADSLGYAATITEFTPFTAGMVCGLPIYGESWQWAFQVNAPEDSITSIFVAGSAAGSQLRTWGNAPLECLINRHKPAHTHALFAYGG